MVSPDRLIPRWYAAAVIGLLLVGTVTYGVLGLVSQGPARAVGLLSAAAFAALLVAASVALLGRRRPRPTPPAGDGTVEVASPAVLSASLLLAWALLLVAAGIWVAVAVTDFDRIEAPGATFLVVAGAAASLPDLVRLLTGRLHRWRLSLEPDRLTYRGYRTDVTIPASRLRGAELQARGPAGVRIRVSGEQPDVVVPVTAFRAPPEQLVELVRDHARAR